MFVHSMFRTGSTYVWAVLRRSGAVWAYYEPLSDYFLERGMDLIGDKEVSRRVAMAHRHPGVNAPYMLEYAETVSAGGAAFKETFPVELAFLSATQECRDLKDYIGRLLGNAKRRPSLHFCRSVFRSDWLHATFDAARIYLWRNIRDQWLSSKIHPYFVASILMLANSGGRWREVADVARALHIPSCRGVDYGEEMALYQAAGYGMSAEHSFVLLYCLWALAFIVNVPKADVVIAMDRLSDDVEYRGEVSARLEECGVGGVDMSDCNCHRSVLDDGERGWFDEAEHAAKALLEQCGVRPADIGALPDWTRLNEELGSQPLARERRAARAAEDCMRAKREAKELRLLLGRLSAEA